MSVLRPGFKTHSQEPSRSAWFVTSLILCLSNLTCKSVGLNVTRACELVWAVLSALCHYSVVFDAFDTCPCPTYTPNTCLHHTVHQSSANIYARAQTKKIKPKKSVSHGPIVKPPRLAIPWSWQQHTGSPSYFSWPSEVPDFELLILLLVLRILKRSFYCWEKTHSF